MGAFSRPLTKLGQFATLDQEVAIDGEVDLGRTGDIKDLWPGYRVCLPVPDNCADRVITAINHFHGSRKIELLYGDNSKGSRRGYFEDQPRTQPAGRATVQGDSGEKQPRHLGGATRLWSGTVDKRRAAWTPGHRRHQVKTHRYAMRR